MSDWTYTPDKQLKKQNKPRVRVAQFGEGYSQRSQDGINPLAQAWQLSFVNRTFTDINAMVSLLETKGGYSSFTFTPPGEQEVKVICREWDVETIFHTGTASTSFGSLNATFERVYE